MDNFLEQYTENKQILWSKYLVAAVMLCLTLSSCSSNENTILNHQSNKIHASIQQKLHNGNYQGAIKEFEALSNYYSFDTYKQQIQIDLIYAYYKSANLALAQGYIDHFMRLNPLHPNIDCVLYMRGLIDMALDDNTLLILFGLNYADRNPVYASKAFCDFMQLVRGYPNSRYFVDAIKRLIYLKNRLAEYELSVVQYYNKHGAYVAVVSRVEQMLRNFPDTQATRQALFYMEIAYRELQLYGQAEKVSKIRSINHI